jgi:hypothetical protein
VEVAAQRMLMKRPTVARTSETGIGPAGRSPTRASEPRTEITRPKDVTMLNLDVMELNWASLWSASDSETVKPAGFRIG